MLFLNQGQFVCHKVSFMVLFVCYLVFVQLSVPLQSIVCQVGCYTLLTDSCLLCSVCLSGWVDT